MRAEKEEEEKNSIGSKSMSPFQQKLHSMSARWRSMNRRGIKKYQKRDEKREETSEKEMFHN